jgi:4,5-DOPA dioxygenase extradiol
MDRKKFLNTLVLIPLAGATMNLNELQKLAEPLSSTVPMPVLFLGHGSPMNAIEDNEFSRGLEGGRENFTKTPGHPMHIGPLGNPRNLCDRHGKTKNDP